MTHQGMPVYSARFLPVPETFQACDLTTKELVNISSGKQIDCMVVDGKIYLSEKVYQALLKSQGV